MSTELHQGPLINLRFGLLRFADRSAAALPRFLKCCRHVCNCTSQFVGAPLIASFLTLENAF